MPKVHFLNESITVDVPEGANLLDVADENGVQVYRGMWPNWNCGGRGICGRCKVWVADSEPVSPPSPQEKVFGFFGLIKGDQRLACQVEIQGDASARTRPIGPAFDEMSGPASELEPASYLEAAAEKLVVAKEEARKKEELAKKKKAAAAKKKAEEAAKKKAEEEAAAKAAEEEAKAAEEAKEAEEAKAAEESKAAEEAKAAEEEKPAEEGKPAEEEKPTPEAEPAKDFASLIAEPEEKPAEKAKPETKKSALGEEDNGWDIDESTLKPPE